MARPKKYTDEEAREARLKSKQVYYQWHRKSERKKALARYNKARQAGRKRTPPSEVKHRRPSRPVSQPYIEAKAVTIHINSKTNIRAAIAEARFSRLLSDYENEDWTTLCAKVNREMKEIDQIVVEASKLASEAWRRNPAGNGRLLPLANCTVADLEALSGLLFEGRVWLEDGGSKKLLQLYDGQWDSDVVLIVPITV
ncbi:hypothetical protein M422DRAFT_270232 [Sphaerobolus stellatus SS14]|uniref:Uncharacterized protein n=1 Tax=Sphaerobolus stellatus (strain SS14) TaxID=990650 RepID=A0A0C9TGD1_SPHS4|nr:hypothetical protein M422DRAFT_270232 [Sphaerobolus stellatus SS14]